MKILNDKKTFNFLLGFLMIIYFVILVWVIIFKCNMFLDGIYTTYDDFKSLSILDRIKINIVPFRPFFIKDFSGGYKNIIIRDVLNFLVFILFGLFCPYFLKKNKVRYTLGIIILSTIGFEIIQLFSLLGAFSTEDMVTNTLGGVVGILLYKLFYRDNRIRLFNILAIGFIVISIPLLIFSIFNTINNIDIYLDILLRRI